MSGLRFGLSAVVAAVLSSLLGCGEISGIDDYSVGPAGSGPLKNPCGALQVVTEEGECIDVGVAACSESEGFESDGEGGCRAIARAVDCAKSQRAPLGSRACAWGQTCSPGGAPLTAVPDPARTRYVDADALSGGDGRDEAHAFATLKEGLAALPSGGYLLVKAGEYRENLVVTQSNLSILGCAGETLLAGETADSGLDDPCRLEYPRKWPIPSKRATICLAPGTANVRLSGLGVTGPGDGVAIVGSTDAALDLVSIQDTGNIGLRVEQAPNTSRAPASATLKQSIVDQATGAGVYVAGARVEIVDSTVRNARLRHEAEAVGVSIHPAGWFGPEDDSAANTRADVTIRKSLITGHSEAAVQAAGARVTIENSLLGNLDEMPASGRGLVAQAGIPFAIATEVTMTGSVIQRTRDAAVDVLCARVTLDGTTLRDTLHGFEPSMPETPAVETCSGQGVRIRSLPLEFCDAKNGVETRLTGSTVTGSRHAAVLDVASKVTLERSLLTRSTVDAVTEACGRTLGNGLVLESLPEQKAEAIVTSSLITKNEGAGIASGWGTLEVGSSRLCDNARDIVVAGEGSASGARCGCGAKLPDCPVERALFDSWLSTGKASAFPERTAAWEAALREFGPSGAAPLAGFGIWDLDHPEVPPVLSDTSGHFRLAYLASLSRPAIWRPEWTPAAKHGVSGRFFGITTAKQSGLQENLDWNLAFVWASSIPQGACVTSSRGPLAISKESFAGVEGIEVRCVNQTGTAILPNLDPGWMTIRLDSLPPGTTCRPDAAPGGFPVAGDPNALRVKLERGMIMNVAFACTSASP